ncbi:MAG: hypothetical protein FWG75_00545 [Cystobacterineae bacterium]|nr:hypothetical protein [Cystobacterineae bacterium]
MAFASLPTLRCCPRFVGATLALLLATTSLQAQAFKVDIDEDSHLTLGILLQPQLQLGNQGPDWGTAQFFSRRTRLIFGGQHKKLGFLFVAEQINWGKGGNWKPDFFVQDAVAFIEFDPNLRLDAGLFIFPLVRYFAQSAGAMHTLDYFIPAIPFAENSHKAYRDMGLQFRGFFLNEAIHFRASISNGVVADATTGTNRTSIPRVATMLRYNFLGSEKNYAISAIYFSKTPMLSLGVGAEYQPNAYVYSTTHNPRQKADSLSLGADVFLEYPFGEKHALLAQANFFHYARGPQNPDSGTGAVIEVGWLIGKIEPLISWGFFNSLAPGHVRDNWSLRPGFNWWIDKHRLNLKLEAGWTGHRLRFNTRKDFVFTAQLQMAL